MSDGLEAERLKLERERLEVERAWLALLTASLQLQRKAIARKNRSWLEKIGDTLYDW